MRMSYNYETRVKWKLHGIHYLVSQRSPLVQLDDDLEVLVSISTCTKLYRQLNLDGLEAYKVSNLCHENQYGI